MSCPSCGFLYFPAPASSLTYQLQLLRCVPDYIPVPGYQPGSSDHLLFRQRWIAYPRFAQGSSPPFSSPDSIISTCNIILRNVRNANTPNNTAGNQSVSFQKDVINPAVARQNSVIFILVLLPRHQAVFSFLSTANPALFAALQMVSAMIFIASSLGMDSWSTHSPLIFI